MDVYCLAPGNLINVATGERVTITGWHQLAPAGAPADVTGEDLSFTLEIMEVRFTPEQEARIAQVAKANGTDAEWLVKDAALQVAEDSAFRAAVMEAKVYADRGEFIEEDEMDARFEEMLGS